MDPAADALLAPLRDHPERSALLLDFDGTLAPIVLEADRAWLARIGKALTAADARLDARSRAL